MYWEKRNRHDKVGDKASLSLDGMIFRRFPSSFGCYLMTINDITIIYRILSYFRRLKRVLRKKEPQRSFTPWLGLILFWILARKRRKLKHCSIRMEYLR